MGRGKGDRERRIGRRGRTRRKGDQLIGEWEEKGEEIRRREREKEIKERRLTE